MGLDAWMSFSVDDEISAIDLLALAVDLHEAFPQGVIINRMPWCRARRTGSLDHVLSIDAETSEHCISDQGGGVYEINLSGSYYGRDYERGPLPVFLAIAHWIRARVPGATVYYYHNEEDKRRELTQERERDLWNHFCVYGHKPCRNYFLRLPEANPTCRLCGIRYRRYDSSGDGHFAAYTCEGCGHSIETRDGGKTWSEK